MATDSVRLTHLALPVSDLERSTAFYERLTSLQVTEGIQEQLGTRVAGLTDSERSFVLSLIETPGVQPLTGIAHLGVSCGSAEEVIRLAEEAREEGCLGLGPVTGPPLGTSAFITDPDGHQIELYHGQHAGIAGA